MLVFMMGSNVSQAQTTCNNVPTSCNIVQNPGFETTTLTSIPNPFGVGDVANWGRAWGSPQVTTGSLVGTWSARMWALNGSSEGIRQDLATCVEENRAYWFSVLYMNNQAATVNNEPLDVFGVYLSQTGSSGLPVAGPGIVSVPPTSQMIFNATNVATGTVAILGQGCFVADSTYDQLVLYPQETVASGNQVWLWLDQVVLQRLAYAGPDVNACCPAIGPDCPIPGATYAWTSVPLDPSLNPTVSNPVVCPTVLTTYYLTVTSPDGLCTDVDTVVVDPDVLNVNITAFPATVCQGGSTTLSANTLGGGPYSYSWSGGITDTDANAVVSPSSATTYSVTITNLAGCIGTASLTVNVSPPPAPTISVFGSTGPYCEDDPNILIVGTPIWDIPSVLGTGVFSSPTSSPFTNFPINFFSLDPTGNAGTHIYNFTYTNIAGCSATVSLTLTIDEDPVISTVPLPSVCESDGLLDLTGYFSASVGTGTFSGPGVTGTDFDPITAGPGTHTITYTVVNGACSSVATQTITVNPGSWQQTTSMTTGNDAGRDVTTDAAGNVYMVGDYSASTTFGSGANTITIPGAGMYIAKYDPCGELIWVAHTQTGRSNGRGVTINQASGWVYVTGYIMATTTPETFVSGLSNVVPTCAATGTVPGGFTSYIARYNMTNGCLLNVLGYGNATSDIQRFESIDHEGNFVYVTGSTKPSLFAIPQQVIVSKSSAISLATSVGWPAVSMLPTTYPCTGNDIAVRGTQIYITGVFGSSIQFAGTPVLNSLAVSDAFVYRFTDLGLSWTSVWRQRASTPGNNNGTGKSISLDASGRLFVTGTYTGTLVGVFGSGTLTGGVDTWAFVCRLAPATGLSMWRQSIRCREVRATGISADASGVYVTGYFLGTALSGIIFPSGTMQPFISTSPVHKSYVARLNKFTGIDLWSNVTEGDGLQRSYNIRADGIGHTFITGEYRGQMNMSPTYTAPQGQLNSTGIGMNAFLVRNEEADGDFRIPAEPAEPVEAQMDPLPFGQDNLLLNLYPNPNNGEFTVELLQEPNTEDLVLEVYDMMGKKVFTKSVSASQRKWQIDLSQYEKGIYLLKASSAGQEVMTRIVIQ
ncbi:MAG: hypothetical protein FD123_2418 [Bacteroidetes bacterium]|nr:MAG: hypothetical protein FD123_2418 [Bacteroidota bacterium]